MSKFWNFKQTNEHEAALYFYGEIADKSWDGDEVTPQQFKHDLDSIHGQDMDIYINSAGGDVFAGLSIYNMIKRAPQNVTVHVDGLAASAASVIAMAGDKIIMPKNSMMMIHNAWTFTAGNAQHLQETAEKLHSIDDALAQIYTDRTGMEKNEIAEMMAAETWMNGAQALAYKFCDEVEENKRVAACADMDSVLARYTHTPEMGDIFSDAQEDDNPVDEVETPVEEPEKEPDNNTESELRKRDLEFRKRQMEME